MPICRTAAEAFQAGYDAPCEHNISPVDCPHCHLTVAEISRLAVLLRPMTSTSLPMAHREAA